MSVLAAGLSAALSAEPDIVRAQLTPRRHAVLAAEIGAKVSRVHVEEGGAFREGDLLLSFDSALQEAQMDRARAVLSAAQKTLTANQRLLELNSVGQIEAELAEAEVAKAKAELSITRAMLSKCEIKAPFSGRVAEQRVRDQEFVQMGQGLLEVIDDAMPQVEFIAPSRWLAWLRVGQAIEIHIDETHGTYAATVERIGARADPVSQSVKIVAGFAEQHPELIAGMSGSVSVSASPVP